MTKNQPGGVARLRLVFLSFLFALIFPATNLYSGAWVHEPGKAYVELGYGFYQANSIFNQAGDKRDLGLLRVPAIPSSALAGLIDSTYRQHEANLYFELGVVPNLELIGSLPFYRVAQNDTQFGVFETSGLGDVVVALKYKAWENRFIVLATSVDVGIPLGDVDAEGDIAGMSSQPMPLGDGEWDVALRAYASHGFYPIPAWISADIGYRYRSSAKNTDYGNDIPWNVDGGYTFELGEDWFPTVTPTLAFQGVLATSEGAFALLNVNASGTSPNQETIDISPGFSLDIYNMLAFYARYSYTLAGKNAGAGWSVRTGFSWEN